MLSQRPSFLSLPYRPGKPRRAGLTHVLDKGCTHLHTEELLASAGAFIDVWKFGWGTAYLDPAVYTKVKALQARRVKACTGGTLLEVAWLQGRTKEFFAFAEEVGFDCVEVSDGASHMPLHEKRDLIARACDIGFEVMAEVGSKDPTKQASAADWLDEIEGDLEAGAHWIVVEGRESGTVGLYDEAGRVRQALFSRLRNSPAASRMIYETPQRPQQSFLIRELGPDVNLGNIDLAEVMGLEALRLGLRADTFGALPNSHVGECERKLGV